MEPIEIKKYLDIAVRRKYWIVIPFLLTILAGLGYALTRPKVYEASTLILVQDQRVPRNYVQPIVGSDIEDRLQTIVQQVTSRTNLETIIKANELYAEKNMLQEEKVNLLRKMILVQVIRGNAFSIAFKDSVPKRAMQIANTLASNFITENLKIREAQAIGTSDFLADELASIKARMSKKEEELKNYREKYMGAMPEYLGANLRILERLQKEAEQLNAALRDAQNRKLIIQQQIAQTQSMLDQAKDLQSSGLEIEYDDGLDPEAGGSQELMALRKQLKFLQIKYTENHPDVRRLREMIGKLEAEEADSEEAQPGTETTQKEALPEFSMGENFLEPQLEQINAEIKGLQRQARKVQEETAMYRSRVEGTPERQLELLEISRDYENMNALYDSMLKRKLEAEVSLNMEKKQKGEQFRIIDPARLPEKPVSPDLRKILLIVFVLGLGLGGGLAYGIESIDTSYKNPEDVEKELRVPILVSMPIRYTASELKNQKKKKILAACSVAIGFFLSTAGIVIAAKGVDKTMQYVKNLLNFM